MSTYDPNFMSQFPFPSLPENESELVDRAEARRVAADEARRVMAEERQRSMAQDGTRWATEQFFGVRPDLRDHEDLCIITAAKYTQTLPEDRRRALTAEIEARRVGTEYTAWANHTAVTVDTQLGGRKRPLTEEEKLQEEFRHEAQERYEQTKRR